MTIQELLDKIRQRIEDASSGGATIGGGGGTAASLTPATASAASSASATPSTSSGAPSGDAGGIGGFLPSGPFGTGIGGPLTGTLASAGAPFAVQTFGLSELPAVLSAIFGSIDFGGVPRSAKSQALVQAMEGSANPLDVMLGQFASRGVDAGDVFSESGSSTFGNSTRLVAQMLQALTGQNLSPVIGTGADFSTPAGWSPPPFAKALDHMRLPQGYGFANDPSQDPTIIRDIMGIVPNQFSYTGHAAQGDWQKLVNELISQGVLQKYRGSLGAPGAQAGTSPSAIPNISLPHPMNQNRDVVPAPYPV